MSWNTIFFGWFLLTSVLPVTLCALVIFRRSLSNWVTLALLLFTSLSAVYLVFAGVWTLYSYWSIVTVLVFVAWAIVVGVRRIRERDWVYPGPIAGLFGGLLLIGAAYFVILNITALQSTRTPINTVELSFPFKDGVFALAQGGAGPPQQSRHLRSPAQVYALDITRINLTGTGRTSLSAEQQETWEIWDKPVHSPCSGKVVWARDGIVDRISVDRETPAGNVIAIECEGVIVYLAHFRQGTVRPVTGDTVEIGQLLGTIGTSGNTVMPHLHIHAEKPPFGGEFSQNDGVAMTFDGRFLWKPGLVILE
jgi:hypothetical protein